MSVSTLCELITSEIQLPKQSVGALSLPRVLYIGDVPVESSYHGSALLFRLLQKYADAGLTIIETASCSSPERRLENADYRWLPLTNPGWLNTRFHPYVSAFYSLAASRMSRKITAALNGFNFDIVLTVGHGFGWLAAAAVAESQNLPFHLIVHDDWPRVARVPRWFRGRIDNSFRDAYRSADSRMCVSPFMRDVYAERYGRSSEVLYPMRDHRCPDFLSPPPRLSRNDHTFTVAFAGTINCAGYVDALKSLESALRSIEGKLLIFGPVDQLCAQSLGLNLQGIVCCGLLSSSELIQRFREEVDALFVPMSFLDADASNMEISFPSKLADYTAVGVPLLIYGPDYCSAIKWARANTGAAVIVTNRGEDALEKAVRTLVDAPSTRLALGTRALEVGRKYFSPVVVQDLFDRSLRH